MNASAARIGFGGGAEGVALSAPWWAIVAVILSAGIIGGYAAYLSEPSAPRTDGQLSPPIPRFLVLGVVASACIPLFLSLVKSSLIEEILKNVEGDRLESFLILMGLCLVAAYSSRTFIDSVSRQVLQRLEETEKDGKAAKKTALQAKNIAQQVAAEVDAEAADDPGEAPPPSLEMVDAIDSGSIDLTPEERKILSAMTNRTYRTRTGIAEDSGIPKNRISDLLEGLAERKLALPTKSPTTGGSRWIITKRGNAALAS